MTKEDSAYQEDIQGDIDFINGELLMQRLHLLTCHEYDRNEVKADIKELEGELETLEAMISMCGGE